MAFIEQMEEPWDELWLDYELGGEKNGFDAVKWLVQNPDKIPRNIYYITNSLSGRARIDKVVRKFVGARLVDRWGTFRAFYQGHTKHPEASDSYPVDTTIAFSYRYEKRE